MVSSSFTGILHDAHLVDEALALRTTGCGYSLSHVSKKRGKQCLILFISPGSIIIFHSLDGFYHLHFERMSNLDLHPLSLPVSRLSPARSSSSIDQYTHHHSKGDSAYSSFSGGSTVPDYSSPFLLDEHQSHSLHYTDLKYAKAKYSPTFLESDSKSMDHLYHSMEAIVQQHHRSSSSCSNVESPPVSTHPLPPPPPPARLDSFVTTRNLENSRARLSPEGQFDDISTSKQTGNPEVCGVQVEPVNGRLVSQNFQRDQLKQDFGDKVLEPPKYTSILSRFPLQTCQPEHLQQSWSGRSETQRKRSHSAYGGPVSEQQCYVNSCHMPQKMISGSIQHKGQFYFVTGVFKSSEPSVTQGVVESGSMETSSEWSYKAQHRRQSCPDGPSGRLFFQEEHKFIFQNKAMEHPSYKSEQTSQGVEDKRVMSKEIGRHHSSSHPIFYCGPEENLVGKTITPALIKEDNTSCPKNEEQITRNSRQPQLDIPREKISKETTPLLYHLTGANRVPFTSNFKNNNDCGMEIKITDYGKDKQKAGKDGQSSNNSEHWQSEVSKEQPNEFSYPCGTLDDSYKMYYKEKLKDAQSKVLRATSFKRTDLQDSWPHRIKQQTNKKLSIVPAGSPSQNIHSSLANPTAQLHKLQGTEKKNMKDLGLEIEKGMEKETEKSKNIAQQQVPRVGSRKRLTADQKKLSHSEPEKLHQMSDEPVHMTCRSLGNEGEGLLSGGDRGLVAARRKMFETRGRALSASNFSKSSLKHLQHKALAAYMERKTGQKVAEPQQPVPQVPSQRNSTAGRLCGWSSRHNSGSADFKKLHRPLSAGRILDSVSSSVKYAQFIPAQPSIHSRQSSSREESPTAGKSASVESLLDQAEQTEFFRARSTSTPHAFHARKHPDEFSTSCNKDISSVQRNVEGDTLVHHSRTASVSNDRRARMVAPRGKSLEELGVSKISSPEVLSKSSEQFDQLQEKQAMSGKETQITKGKEQMDSKLNQSCFPLLSFGEYSDKSQAGPEKQLSKQISPTPDSLAFSYSQLKTSFSPPDTYGSHGIAAVKNVPSREDEIHLAPHCNGTKNRDDTRPSHSTESGEIKLDIRKEQEVSPLNVSEAPVSSQEVSFSHGVTADPSLWISVPETNETEAKNCPSSETKTFVESQNAVPTPCCLIETTPITTLTVIPRVESSQTPALSREQEVSEKEVGSLVTENKRWKDPKDKLEWEVLVQEVVSADQSLARSLYPTTNRKTALMLMEQLLSEDTLLMEEHYKKKQEKKVNNPGEAAHSAEMPEDDKPSNPPSSLNDDTALSNNQKDKLCNTEMDIIEKKRQLIAHIEEHLKSLEEVRSTLQSEEKENGARGDAMETLVRESCVPAELERYTQFIGDLERVVSLLLCLSARLARVQNALSTVDDKTDTEEKQSLDNRHHLLCRQREDAKDLKDNLDRRERLVSTFLSKQLTDAQLQEYRRFIQTKASLLIRQKDLDEKQRLGEEQLEAVLNSIPL
ncbi:protein Shroom3-like [Myxocyprinus asiaticus]|uniref:protein Shroom3-like n=1 Tax=Myxocyprinus asiaticus TaxID=70543 RepID=UPI0022218BE6|nr:protein Shroom3-like [Myxocyprinus asiaticus]